MDRALVAALVARLERRVAFSVSITERELYRLDRHRHAHRRRHPAHDLSTRVDLTAKTRRRRRYWRLRVSRIFVFVVILRDSQADVPRRLTTAAGPKRARTSTFVRMSRGSASKSSAIGVAAGRRAGSSERSPSSDRTCRRRARVRPRAGCRTPRGAASRRCSRRRRDSRCRRAAIASRAQSPARNTGCVTTGVGRGAAASGLADRERDDHRQDPGVARRAPSGRSVARQRQAGEHQRRADRQRIDRQVEHLQRQVRRRRRRCCGR